MDCQTNSFKDRRLENRMDLIEVALTKSKSSSIHKSIPDSSARKGAYRFLSNDKVSEEILKEDLFKQCKILVANKRVFAFCDTSSLNTSGN